MVFRLFICMQTPSTYLVRLSQHYMHTNFSKEWEGLRLSDVSGHRARKHNHYPPPRLHSHYMFVSIRYVYSRKNSFHPGPQGSISCSRTNKTVKILGNRPI